MKDRNFPLFCALVLSFVGCVIIGWAEVAFLLFFAVLPFFFLQLILLRRTRRWYVRILPTLPILPCGVLAGYYWVFGQGWDRLGALIFGLMALVPAVGCGVALGVYLLTRSGLPRPRLRCWAIGLLVVLGCAGSWVGQDWCLDYWDAALVKFFSLTACFGLVTLLLPREEIRGLFARPDGKSLRLSLLLSAGVVVFLLGGCALLSPWLDLSNVPEQLRLRDITAETFPAIALYIIFVNSFLEELFFRGLAFLTLRRYAPAPLAWGFSALAFALYHVSIMDNWFHPSVFVLMIAGLGAAGLLFNWLDRRGSIWCAWVVHAGANLGINLIGCRLLELI